MMKIFLYLLTAFVLSLCSCKHDPDAVLPGTSGTQQPVGESLGEQVTKQIGPAGGSLRSGDGTLTITVPAGALTALTEVGIEPITSTCPGGIGDGWRLTPHGNVFAKPVEIKLNYTTQKDSVSLPQALGLAYQDSKGVWRFVGATASNASTHTLAMQTKHFSDWVVVQWMTLSPISARVGQKQQVTLKALKYITPSLSEDGLVLLSVAEYENGYPIAEPEPLDPNYIKKWSLGGVGTLTVSAAINEAVYSAPSQVQKTSTAAVSLELKGVFTPFTGQNLLVSNITVMGFEIAYLQVAEKNGPGGGRDSELIIYGNNFGAQDKAKSSVTVDGQVIGAQDISLWGDNIIVCRIPMIGPGSSGPVRVKTASGFITEPHLLNEWTVPMRISRPSARVGQSMNEAATIYLRIRGDASPVPPDLTLIYDEDSRNTVAFKSYVHWEAQGEGFSTMRNAEFCGTEKEVWTKSAGDIDLTFMASPTDKQYFNVNLYHLPGKGFTVSFTYEAKDVVPSTHVSTDCRGNTIQSNRPHSIGFPSEFHEERFPLLFSGNTLKGGKSAMHETGVNCYLHYDFDDSDNWGQTIQLTWDTTSGKF
ncbi:IPT/TIG domain-containing protein [Fibrivirga algicola]|nr:IPT/TIG domain-containing protein [Fibrivirga algicola]